MQVGQNVEALLVGIANGWRPMLSIRLASPRPSDAAAAGDDDAKPTPAGGFDAREERDLREELGDMPQVQADSDAIGQLGVTRQRSMKRSTLVQCIWLMAPSSDH